MSTSQTNDNWLQAAHFKYCGSLGHPSESNSNLIYMRACYYDPLLGRFISEDPAKDGGNWYAYAGNNPVGTVDPDGRSPVDFSVATAEFAVGYAMVMWANSAAHASINIPASQLKILSMYGASSVGVLLMASGLAGLDIPEGTKLFTKYMAGSAGISMGAWEVLNKLPTKIGGTQAAVAAASAHMGALIAATIVALEGPL